MNSILRLQLIFRNKNIYISDKTSVTDLHDSKNGRSLNAQRKCRIETPFSLLFWIGITHLTAEVNVLR